MLLGSAKAVRCFRDGGYAGQIGLVYTPGVVQTLRDTPDYREAAENADLYYNDCVGDPVVKGWFSEKLIAKMRASGVDLSYVLEGDEAVFRAGTVDFLGLNSYVRHLVKPYTDGESTVFMNNKGKKNAINHGRTIIKNWFEVDYDPNARFNAWGA